MSEAVAVAQLGEVRVDLAHAAAGADQGFELSRRGAAHGHARAVVEDKVKRFDVVHHLAGHQAVNAATVVADHAAESAAGMRRGIRTISQMVQLGGFAQTVEDDARLDARQLCNGIDRG
jgi:hypothetical protein